MAAVPAQVSDALVTVVIPSFNEERTIEEIIRRVAAVPFRTEIIVVDDGSTDDTAAILARLEGDIPQLATLPQAVNRGKGAAVRVGIAQSRGDFVVIQDADLEYDPADLARLLEPLLRGVADAVYGTRLRGGEPQRAHLFWHYAGNRFLSLLTNVLFRLVSNDFRFEPEVTAKVLKVPGVRLYEVPIAYYGRTVAEGKKITWRDGIKALGALIRFRFRA
jgi:glycosyltransferase involved in cell wall biosynthesis